MKVIDVERKNALKKELNKISDMERENDREERLKRAKKLIGKCFKYRNGASTDAWWLYSKVVGHDRDGYLTFLSIEKWSGTEITLRTNFGDHLMQYPISRSEFKRQWKRIFGKIEKVINV